MKGSPLVIYQASLIGVPEGTARVFRDLYYQLDQAFHPTKGHQHSGEKRDGAVLDGSGYIRLVPEYPGAIIYQDPDSDYDHTGVLSGAWDGGHNCYSFITAETTATQECTIVVRFPVPYNFVKWQNCKYYSRISATAYSGTVVELSAVYDTDNTLVGPAGDIIIGQTTWTATDFEIPTGTFTEGELMTLVFKLRAAAYQSSTYSYAFLGEVYLDAW